MMTTVTASTKGNICVLNPPPLSITPSTLLEMLWGTFPLLVHFPKQTLKSHADLP